MNTRMFAVACGLAAISTFVRADEGSPANQERLDGDLAARIAELEKTLSGATLVGHFTEDGGDQPPELSADRYELATVQHVGEGMWRFEARIRYGEHDFKLPLTVPIRWAGDTPVIVVDQLPVIGMGKFDARVMLFRDRYAGYWTSSGTTPTPKRPLRSSKNQCRSQTDSGRFHAQDARSQVDRLPTGILRLADFVSRQPALGAIGQPHVHRCGVA